MADYHFGIEIEVIAAPHKIRDHLSSLHAFYYGKLAAALQKRGLKAQADDLQRGYGKRPEHYDKWWITKDGSLGSPVGKIPMEAVSPILRCRDNWENEIDTFWASMRAVFHIPERSLKCGSHIHVSRGQGSPFSLSQFKTIAYGIVLYETLILELLMRERSNNLYCRPNTLNSPRLRQCGSDRVRMGQLINLARDTTSLRDTMQNDRYVLWNFDNILAGRSGTIEFRGGRCLRGEVRSKRWIAFTLALIDAILSMNNLDSIGTMTIPRWSAEALYSKIKQSARGLSVGEYLPHDYHVLNESQRE